MKKKRIVRKKPLSTDVSKHLPVLWLCLKCYQKKRENVVSVLFLSWMELVTVLGLIKQTSEGLIT